MKVCFKCNLAKEFSEFYRHSQMSDGYLNKCKDCTKTDVHLNRIQNLDAIREYDRSRSKLPHRVSLRAKIYAEYKEKYPERVRANTAVGNALRDGKLAKHPCFVCGGTQVEAHHPVYSMPLDVVWLCRVHHREIHLTDKLWIELTEVH